MQVLISFSVYLGSSSSRQIILIYWLLIRFPSLSYYRIIPFCKGLFILQSSLLLSISTLGFLDLFKQTILKLNLDRNFNYQIYRLLSSFIVKNVVRFLQSKYIITQWLAPLRYGFYFLNTYIIAISSLSRMLQLSSNLVNFFEQKAIGYSFPFKSRYPSYPPII